jgi:hypothetical protein
MYDTLQKNTLWYEKWIILSYYHLVPWWKEVEMFEVHQLEHMIKNYLKLIKVKQDLQKKKQFCYQSKCDQVGANLDFI